MPESNEQDYPGQAHQSLNPASWVEDYADYLFNFALARLADEELAKDVVQETFLAALEAGKKYEGRSSEKTWLTAILKNKIADVYRKKINAADAGEFEKIVIKEQEQYFDADSGHWAKKYYPQDWGVEPEDRIGRKELGAMLAFCIKKMPVLWTAVFTMKQVDEQLTATICREFNLTTANFWVIMHRARLSLRACLEKKLKG